ncbi:FAD-dependent oxidoreductase [Nocardioides mangrovi]|uniref:FAD-dependent oxidoreductase n=1 Tax=Nocardioides mangrovi TaxID=2874580 RepID=A0ABS7UH30_9ACTN|nr:cyclic nucleotide-binding domain-containing thioredoxin-disulfide reductase [Nocardioides mangrovi]MBZ5740320.1 FAD-dependent oxidoreductase [Nocardioides mangrovi]
MTIDDAPPTPRLSEEQFERLSRYGERQLVEEGKVLYKSGDRRYDLFLVETALIDVVRDATAVEPEHVVYTRRTGEFTGELSLLTGQTVFLTARVRRAGTVVRIDAERFRDVLGEQVDIADVVIEAFRVRRRIIMDSAASVLEIVGPAGSAATRALRTYAARLQLPHVSIDTDSIEGQSVLATHGLAAGDLPAAVVSDRLLVRATPRDLAAAIGFSYADHGVDVDLVVVGAGPAGLAAAVYGASEGLVTVLLDSAGPGGQAATSSRIENYLGFPRGVSGEELTRLALVQALRFGAPLYTPCEVVALDVSDPGRPCVALGDGTRLRSRAVIVATGARYRRLGIPGWEDYEGRGEIRYSATELDARDCQSRPVTVVGGANSAGQAALFLASRGSRVDVVVRRDGVDATMSAYLARRLEAHPMVRLWTGAQVVGLRGEDALAGVVVRREGVPDEELESRTVFCFIGAEPDTGWLAPIARDADGFVLTATRLGADEVPAGQDVALPFQTSVRHLFCVGDVRAGSMKRVASAVGEGASAVASVHRVLAEDDHPPWSYSAKPRAAPSRLRGPSCPSRGPPPTPGRSRRSPPSPPG